MFPGEENPAPAVKKARKLRPPSKKVLLISGSLLALCLTLTAFLVFIVFGTPSVSIPANITQKAKSPIYLPTNLPGDYQIDDGSFTLVEGDTVLIFSAKDGVGSSLIFSEQARPKDFDFDNFHKGNFEDPKTLSDVSYTSVWGKAIDGRVALSIVTNDTWLLIATSAPLTGDDMQQIAANIKKY